MAPRPRCGALLQRRHARARQHPARPGRRRRAAPFPRRPGGAARSRLDRLPVDGRRVRRLPGANGSTRRAPSRPTSERSLRRAAGRAGLARFRRRDRQARRGVPPVRHLRARRAACIDNLRAGTARRIVKPGQVFNRIHVDDIARVLAAAIDKDARHRIYNVSDDEPAPPAGRGGLRGRTAGAAGAAGDAVRGRPGCAAWRRASGPKASASATPASSAISG